MSRKSWPWFNTAAEIGKKEESEVPVICTSLFCDWTQGEGVNLDNWRKYLKGATAEEDSGRKPLNDDPYAPLRLFV